MRTLFVFIVGIAVGAVGYYVYQAQPRRSSLATRSSQAARSAAVHTRAAAGDMSATFAEKMREWHLTPDDIRADLAKTGAVARENTARAREKVADVRIVAVIKAKFVLDRDLSARTIHVESHNGSVTLTGTVNSPDLIGRAVAEALDTDGVHHVVSKIDVTPGS